MKPKAEISEIVRYYLSIDHEPEETDLHKEFICSTPREAVQLYNTLSNEYPNREIYIEKNLDIRKRFPIGIDDLRIS